MGQLKRGERRLLKTVQGRPHASSDDHEDDAHVTKFSATSHHPLQTSRASTKRMRYDRKAAAISPLKRPATEVIEIKDTPPKKARREGTKNQAEASLPSPDWTESSHTSFIDGAIMIENEADFDREPESSDENDYNEKPNIPQKDAVSTGPGFRTTKVPDISKLFKAPPKKDDRQFKGLKSGTSKPERPKRKANEVDDEDLEISDGEGFDFGSTLSKKRSRMIDPRQKRTSNIHANARRPQVRQYGQRATKLQQVKQQKAAERQAKTDADHAAAAEGAQKKTFKTMKIGKSPVGDSSQSTKTFHSSFASAGAGPDFLDADTSPLSDLSDDELEEIDISDGVAMMKCAFCGDRVKKSQREDFEIEYLRGRSLTYKWQRRFCTWHKRQTASELWKQRGYPEIDWSNLGRRMRQHEAMLILVINNEVESHYRKRLKEKSKRGLEGLKGDITDEGHGKGGASMGYYGPKGEKLITEYIVNCLSANIRKRSTKDKLISAASIQGGVAGFVQIVLAPHLVELLVKEDMGLGGDNWDIKAREIIAESAEIGELLNSEEDSIDDGAHVTEFTDLRQDEDEPVELDDESD